MTADEAHAGQARRAQLRREYKERAKQAGVFRVRNEVNGRILLASGLDLRGPLNRVAFELDMGACQNAELKRDLATFGRNAFVVEVVELVEPGDDPSFDAKRELEALEQRHLALLDWETAYNKDSRIRFP